MSNFKVIFIRLITTTLSIFILVLNCDAAFANINNPTPLIILHGGPELNNKQLTPELQPFEDYKALQAITLEQGSKQKEDNIFKFAEITTQIEEITKNYKNKYEIFAHSIGGIILFEYIKSITTESSGKELLASPAYPVKQAQSLPK